MLPLTLKCGGDALRRIAVLVSLLFSMQRYCYWPKLDEKLVLISLLQSLSPWFKRDGLLALARKTQANVNSKNSNNSRGKKPGHSSSGFGNVPTALRRMHVHRACSPGAGSPSYHVLFRATLPTSIPERHCRRHHLDKAPESVNNQQSRRTAYVHQVL